MPDIFSGLNVSLMADNPTPQESQVRATQVNAHFAGIAAHAFLAGQERAIKERTDIKTRAGFVELANYLSTVTDWADPKSESGAWTIIANNPWVAKSHEFPHMMENFKAARMAKDAIASREVMAADLAASREFIASENRLSRETTARMRLTSPHLDVFNERVSNLPIDEQRSVLSMSTDPKTGLPSKETYQALSLIEARLGIVPNPEPEFHPEGNGVPAHFTYGKGGKQIHVVTSQPAVPSQVNAVKISDANGNVLGWGLPDAKGVIHPLTQKPTGATQAQLKSEFLTIDTQLKGPGRFKMPPQTKTDLQTRQAEILQEMQTLNQSAPAATQPAPAQPQNQNGTSGSTGASPKTDWHPTTIEQAQELWEKAKAAAEKHPGSKDKIFAERDRLLDLGGFQTKQTPDANTR